MSRYYYTYVLQSKKDKRFYVGYTSDVFKRLISHNEGKVRSTKGRVPFRLIYFEACLSRSDAMKREKYLKSGYGREYLKKRIRKTE